MNIIILGVEQSNEIQELSCWLDNEINTKKCWIKFNNEQLELKKPSPYSVSFIGKKIHH